MIHRTAVLMIGLACAAPVCALAAEAGEGDAAAEQPQAGAAGEGEAAFYAGLDLREAGDCEGAIARFELALARDPGLVQSHLYIAECCLSLGLEQRAVDEVRAYLEADVPGAETARARELLESAGVDPDTFLPPDMPFVPPPSRVPERVWTPVRLEFGGAVDHHANRIGLTAGGPSLDVRWLPLPFVELGVGGQLGIGAYPDHDGVVQVPRVRATVAASIGVGRVRILAGASVPVLLSRYAGEPRVDVGVVGEVGLRLALPGSRLVVGASVRGGWVVRPTVGGVVALGLQLGPWRR